MDPTIYTLGDPLIVREALLALATIFGAGAWYDGGNGFGLGGNFLAAALIGLVGIVLAGINTQTLRLDYLLTAFILFGIAFGAKTDVNVEDIQTGTASTVANVPIGVAYVGAMSSAAAVDLTETISTALQRPGSTTSTLTASGFLNPLMVLYGLRKLRLETLDPLLHRSMLEYYRYCVGKTLEQVAPTFDMQAYLRAEDPLGYLLDPTHVGDWLTIEYTAASPNGTSISCHTVIPNLQARLSAVSDLASTQMAEWLGRQYAANKTFNEPTTVADVDTVVDILSRGGWDGQDFMIRQFLANMHNEGEAWRIAEYGTDKAMYVATLTEAMEENRVEVAAQGSMFLQFMFPLMGFFQFLFFALPPLIAMIMIAAPMASLRILGFYMLFGVWAYGWLPIAAVINHYIEIAVQNDIAFAVPGLGGSGYTSIAGFSSLYNVVATKLAIGANALAATPMILGALLTATPFAISNIAGRFGGGRINTGMSAPSLMSNGPVVQRAGLTSFAAGSVASAGGKFVGASFGQRQAYGSVNWGSTLTRSMEAASQRSSEASREFKSISDRIASQVRGVATSSELESGQKSRIEASIQRSVGAAYRNSVDESTQKSLTAEQAKQVQARYGLDMFGSGASESTADLSSFNTAQKAAYNQMLAKSDQIAASVGKSLTDTGELETSVNDRLSKDVREAQAASETAAQSEAYAEQAREAVRLGRELGLSGNVGLTDFATEAYRRNAGAYESLRAIVAGAGGAAMLAEFDAKTKSIFEESAPIGLDGKKDKKMDSIDRLAASMQALDQMAGNDEKAAMVYMEALKSVGGVSVPFDGATVAAASKGVAGAEADVSDGERVAREAADTIRSTQGDVASAGRRVNALGDGIAAAARDRKDVEGEAADWFQQTEAAFEQDAYGVRSAAANVDAAIEAAQREQGNKLSAKTVGLLQPGAGADDQARKELAAVPEGRGVDAVRQGATAVAALGGLVRAQGDITASPEKVYSDFVKMGWSPKAAAEAAFASAGIREVGGVDMLGLGAGASAGMTVGMEVAGTKAGNVALTAAEAAKGAARAGNAAEAAAAAKVAGNAGRFANWLRLGGRVGGPLAGAATTVIAAGLVKMADADAVKQIDAAVQKDLMTAARQELGAERFAEFENYLEKAGGVDNAEELANRLQAFANGDSEVTGSIGAFPTIGGTVGEQVDGFDEEIRKDTP